MAKRSYHVGNLRERLLETSLAFLKEGRVSDLSIRDLARTVGVSPTALYSHFKNRDDLIAELATEGFRILITYLVNDEAPLLEVCRRYLQFGLENPEYYKIMFGEKLEFDFATYPDLQLASQEAFKVLVQVIENNRKAKVINVSDPEEVGVFIWSSLHGFLALHERSIVQVALKSPRERAKAVEKYCKFLVKSLC